MPPNPARDQPPMSRIDHPAAWPDSQLLAECKTQRTRRSGPGGQHRNKVQSAVVLTHVPTGVVAEASERRSQHENHAVALFRLRINLALEVRSEEPAVSPTPLWQSRCRGGKLAINTEHSDFPAILAEALDAVAARNWDVREATACLESTSSQLVKLFQKEPRALLLVNRHRREAGLTVLQ